MDASSNSSARRRCCLGVGIAAWPAHRSAACRLDCAPRPAVSASAAGLGTTRCSASVMPERVIKAAADVSPLDAFGGKATREHRIRLRSQRSERLQFPAWHQRLVLQAGDFVPAAGTPRSDLYVRRFARAILVGCLDRNIPTAGCVASRDPCPSTSTHRAAAQIPEAIGVR